MHRFTHTLIVLAFALLSATPIIAQQCDIIYVTPTGATSGTAGTKDNPADINYAVSLMTPSIRKVYLSVGIYNLETAFPLVDDVTFEGGFNSAADWAKVTNPRTIIIRDSVGVQPSPNRVTAIEAVGINNWRVQDVDFIMTDAPDSIDVSTLGVTGVTNYGIYIDDCNDFSLVRTKVIAGNGGNGQAGADGADGSDGAAGAIGEQGDECGSSNRAGGAGGNAWSAGTNAGGDGGDGAEGNAEITFSFPLPNFTSECDPPATNGTDGSGSNPGNGGTPAGCITSGINTTNCGNAPIHNGKTARMAKKAPMVVMVQTAQPPTPAVSSNPGMVRMVALEYLVPAAAAAAAAGFCHTINSLWLQQCRCIWSSRC